MTPAEVITETRRIIQDELTPYRYSDAVLLGYVNQTLKRMAMLRPDLFSDIVEIPTQTGSAVQTLPVGALRLLDVFQVKDGPAINEVDRETMNRNYPNWMTEPAGVPVNFMRHVKNPDRFFLYPRPQAGVILVGEYAATPPDYALGDSIDLLSGAYFPAIVDGTVYLAESIDDEHVASGRAKLFFDSFVQSLSASLDSRKVTDTKSAGLDRGEVI
jgi:hypothetical protein